MKGFVLKTDYTDLIDLLSDDCAGLLLRAIMHYARDGFVEADITQFMENGVEILFQIIRKDIDAEREDCDE